MNRYIYLVNPLTLFCVIRNNISGIFGKLAHFTHVPWLMLKYRSRLGNKLIEAGFSKKKKIEIFLDPELFIGFEHGIFSLNALPTELFLRANLVEFAVFE